MKTESKNNKRTIVIIAVVILAALFILAARFITDYAVYGNGHVGRTRYIPQLATVGDTDGITVKRHICLTKTWGYCVDETDAWTLTNHTAKDKTLTLFYCRGYESDPIYQDEESEAFSLSVNGEKTEPVILPMRTDFPSSWEFYKNPAVLKEALQSALTPDNSLADSVTLYRFAPQGDDMQSVTLTYKPDTVKLVHIDTTDNYSYEETADDSGTLLRRTIHYRGGNEYVLSFGGEPTEISDTKYAVVRGMTLSEALRYIVESEAVPISGAEAARAAVYVNGACSQYRQMSEDGGSSLIIAIPDYITTPCYYFAFDAAIPAGGSVNIDFSFRSVGVSVYLPFGKSCDFAYEKDGCTLTFVPDASQAMRMKTDTGLKENGTESTVVLNPAKERYGLVFNK